MKAKNAILTIALSVMALSISAQGIYTEGDVKVTSKKIDRVRKQFFVHSSSGALLESGFYRSNNPDLTWIQYDEDGSKLILAQFQNGRKEGTWYIWDEEGFLKYEIHYLNNTIQRAVERDRTGALVARR